MSLPAYRGGFSSAQRRQIRWASRLARQDGVAVELYGNQRGFTGCTIKPLPNVAAQPDPGRPPGADKDAPETKRSVAELAAARDAGDILSRGEKRRLRSAERSAKNKLKELAPEAAGAAGASAPPAPATRPSTPDAALRADDEDAPMAPAATAGKRQPGGPSPVKAAAEPPAAAASVPAVLARPSVLAPARSASKRLQMPASA